MAFEKLAKFLGKKKEHPMRDNKNRIRPDRFEHQDEVSYIPGEHTRDTVHVEDRRAAYDEMLQKSSKEHKNASEVSRKSPDGPIRHVAVRRAHESANAALRNMPGRKKVKSYR